MNPLAITGFSQVSALGVGRRAFEAALADTPHVDRFAAPTLFEEAQYPGARVAEAREFDPAAVLGDKGLRNLDRLTKLFLVAARGAMEDAGVKQAGEYKHYSGPRAGICASTAYGSLEAIMELHRVAVLEDPRYINPARFPNTVINSALGYVSIWEDLRAVNATVCNGNCGPLDAVLCAETYLASRRADVILVGGAEAMHEGLYLAFHRLESHATQDRSYAPGSPTSQGMRLGEGAALLVLERSDDARARKANIVAEIIGYGTTFDPPESEALIVHASKDAVTSAVRIALDDAGVKPEQVDAVVSSANGLRHFDSEELDALQGLLGERAAVIAPKSQWGELLGGAGALGMCTAGAWLHGANVQPPIRGTFEGTPSYVLVTTVGFYGNVSAVLLRRAS